MDWEIIVNVAGMDQAPDHVKNWACNMMALYGRDWKVWPKVGCGAKFVPWLRGPSTILEFQCGNTSKAMVAVRCPPILLEEIYKVRSDFALSLNAMSPEEIQQVMPNSFHTNSLIDGKVQLPGIARFPVDQWEAEGRPIFDEAAWCALCIHVVETMRRRLMASDSTNNLNKLFQIAKELQSKLQTIA